MFADVVDIFCEQMLLIVLLYIVIYIYINCETHLTYVCPTDDLYNAIQLNNLVIGIV